MNVYTLQLARWRKAVERGIDIVDTTVKSGISAFAPTWEMVLDIKSGKITKETYTKMYDAMMAQSREENKERWDELCKRHTVAVACYCPKDTFCHRHLLLEHIKHHCDENDIPFEAMGELDE